MNNQSDNTIALHPLDMSLDPVEEVLTRLSPLSKERRKKAALQLLNQLRLAERTEIARGARRILRQPKDERPHHESNCHRLCFHHGWLIPGPGAV